MMLSTRPRPKPERVGADAVLAKAIRRATVLIFLGLPAGCTRADRPFFVPESEVVEGRFSAGTISFYEHDLVTPAPERQDFEDDLRRNVTGALRQSGLLSAPGERGSQLRFRVCYSNGPIALWSWTCYFRPVYAVPAPIDYTIQAEIWRGDKLLATTYPDHGSAGHFMSIDQITSRYAQGLVQSLQSQGASRGPSSVGTLEAAPR